MKVLGIIPARYDSQRLPGKPLIDLRGKTMIRRVYDQCMQVEGLDDVVVATDNLKVMDEVRQWQGKCIMTERMHQSGTDRCAEALSKLNNKDEYDFIINIQGDEPFIQPAQIEDLISILNDEMQIGTLISRVTEREELEDPNKPKVVIRKDGTAIYFTRQTIPYMRVYKPDEWVKHHFFYKHIGIYAFRADILTEITKLRQTGLEIAEHLEQLRWIEHNYTIQTKLTKWESLGIDTEEDVRKAREKLAFEEF